MRNDALDARNFFDPPRQREAQARPEAVRGRGHAAPSSRTRRSSWSTTTAPASSAGSARSSSCPTPTSWPAGSPRPITDPADRRSRSRTTPSPRRASRGSRRWRCRTGGPAPELDLAPGQLPGRPDASPDPEPVHGPRSTRTSASYGRAFVRFTDARYDNRTTLGERPGHLGDRVFVQDTKNWQVSHTWPIRSNLVNSFRVGRVDADAPQHGVPCDAGRSWTQRRSTGIFQDIPDDQRNCSEHRHPEPTPAPAAPVNAYTASNQPMWDVSNTTTWIKGDHTLELRRQLPPVVAAAGPGHRVPRATSASGTGSASPAIRSPTCSSATTSGVGVFQPAALRRPGSSSAIRARSTSCTSPRTSRTTGRSARSSP